MNFKSFYSIIIFTFVAGLIAGIYLIPDSTTMGLYYLNSAKYDKAIKILNSAYKKGDYSIDVIIPLSRLYIKTGEVHKGIKIIRDYISKHQNSLEARELLGDYLKKAQESAEYINNLEHIFALSSSPKVLKKLSKLYKQRGDIQKEIRTAIKLINNKHIKASSDTYKKLVYYYASNNNHEKAVNTIHRFINKKNVKNLKLNTARLFLTVLLDNNKNDLAYKFALKYLKNNDEKIKVASITNLFSKNNKKQVSLKLLTKLLKDSKKEYNYLHAFYLSQNGKRKQAYNLLKEKFSNSNFNKDSAEFLLKLAIQNNDKKIIKKIVKNFNLKNFSEDTLVQLSLNCLSRKDVKLSQIVSKNLGSNYLSMNKLISYLLKNVNKNRNLTRILSNTINNFNLTESQKYILANFAYGNGIYQQSYNIFKDTPNLNILRNLGIKKACNLIIQYGNPSKSIKFFEKKYKQENNFSFKASLLYLSIASDRNKKINKYLLNTNKPYPLQYLLYAFDAAERYDKSELALTLAQKIFKKNKGVKGKLCYAKAYYLKKNFSRSLTYINKVKKLTNISKREILKILNKISKEKQEDANLNNMFNKIIKRILSSKNITIPEKAEIAYILVNLRQKKKAQKLFWQIAYETNHYSQYLDQALFLSQNKIPEKYLSWIIKKIKSKGPKNFSSRKWISVLIKGGKLKKVISLIAQSEITPDNIDLYLEALAKSEKKKKFDKFLNILIKQKWLNKLNDTQKINLLNSVVDLKGYNKFAYQIIKTIPLNKIVKNVTISAIIYIYIQNNKIQDLKSEYSKTQQDIENEKDKKLLRIFFAIFNNKLDSLKSLIKQIELNNSELLDLYYFSNSRQFYQASLLLAKKLYKNNSSNKNKRILASAFYNNSEYKKSLKDLIPLIKNNYREAYLVYLSALYQYAEKNKEIKKGKYQNTLDIIYKYMYKNKDVSKAAKRELVYVLSEYNMIKKAMNISFELAKNKKPKADDVKQLIYLWGKKSWPKGRKWLIQNAKKSSGMERLRWLEYLNRTGNSKAVLKLMQENN